MPALKLKQALAEAGAASPLRYADALRRAGMWKDCRRMANGPPVQRSEEASRGLPMYTFRAVFAEVRVDEDIPIPRVRRVVGVYSAGKIINPKTANSQMTRRDHLGIGQALLEKSTRWIIVCGRSLCQEPCRHIGACERRRA